jgi:DNA-binding transcriptional ArsR family regulator
MGLVEFIDDAATVQVLSHPLRLQILEELHRPRSAASVARQIGQTRQNTNYHLKELERADLVDRAGERRVGNFVETLYQARARTIVVSPRLTWGGPARPAALASQVSLERLVRLAERLGRDAIVLLDRAAFDGETVASAAVDVEVHFKDEAARAAFLGDFVTAVSQLAKQHGGKSGEPFRVTFAAYPNVDVR